MKKRKWQLFFAFILILTLAVGPAVQAAGPSGEVVPAQGESEEQQEPPAEGEEPESEEKEEVVEEPETEETEATKKEDDSEEAQPEDEAVQAEVEEEAQPDAATQALLEEYGRLLAAAKKQSRAAGYAAELAKFPAAYQTELKKLHQKYPNWTFKAVNTGLKWNDVVAGESVSGPSTGTNRSLLPKTAASLLLSKASTDYSASKGAYIPKDGSTWVSASKPAVANYVDPRNFLTEEYMFLFEALDYDKSYHNLTGVENILKGTDLAKKKISYVNTKGQTVNTSITYGEAILAAGAKYGVSPLFLAAKIRQETGGKLTNGSISGKFSYNGVSYRGYYNFYNIGATSTSTGSAVANGLSYAKGGSTGAKTYGRPWTSPVLAINGGAEFLSKSYISKGQDTVYFQKFNTIASPYYQHQYMQNLTGAASEARTTYNSYRSMGISGDSFVFYIPVYSGMPSETTKITISKSVKTGKTTTAVTMRSGPSTGYSKVTTVPGGANVTVNGGVFTDKSVTVSSQQSNPYWLKITYGSKTGYISANYLNMNTDSTIKAGSSKQLSVKASNAGEKIYYETSNPAVATVNTSGKVTGVKKGACTIYAVSSSGRTLDAIGISVSAASTASVSVATPKLVSAKYSSGAVKVTWKAVSNAKGYYVYRKTSGTGWSRIGKVTSGKTLSYKDTKASAGKKYIYTVRAYNGSTLSSYDKNGVSCSVPKKTTYLKYKTTTRVKYRSGAGTKYASKGTLAKGTTVSVVKGWSKTANGYKWYKILRSGKTYYVAAKYLKRI